MNIEVLTDPGSVAERAASVIAGYAGEAIASRGSFVMAVSGGHTPWIMLRRLAAAQIPWHAVHIVQVDERLAPAGHPDRNLTWEFVGTYPASEFSQAERHLRRLSKVAELEEVTK